MRDLRRCRSSCATRSPGSRSSGTVVRRRHLARFALEAAQRRHRQRRHGGYRAAAARAAYYLAQGARPVRRRARAEAGHAGPDRCDARRPRVGACPRRHTARSPGRVRERLSRLGRRRRACWCASPARGCRRAADDLVPVKLRRGGRVLGGSLSWEQPKTLAAFEPPSPFVGLKRAERSHRDAPGAGRARTGPAGQDLGAALRRHAARHRRLARQGQCRAVPRDGRHDVVEPADLGVVRGHAEEDRRACRASTGRARPAGAAEAKVAEAPRARSRPWRRARTLDGFGMLGPPPPTAKPVPVSVHRRRRAGAPAGLLRNGGVAACRRHTGADRYDPGRRSRRPQVRDRRRCMRPSRSICGHGSIAGAFLLFVPRQPRGALARRQAAASGAASRAVAAALVLGVLGAGFVPCRRSRRADATAPPARRRRRSTISPRDLVLGADDAARLCRDGRRQGRRGQRGRGSPRYRRRSPTRTSLNPGDPDRHRSVEGRARLLPACSTGRSSPDDLATHAEGDRADFRLHAPGRHHRLRYARRVVGPAVRRAVAGDRMAAASSWPESTCRSSSRCRADHVVTKTFYLHRWLHRPLRLGRDLDRGAAATDRRQPGSAPRAPATGSRRSS